MTIIARNLPGDPDTQEWSSPWAGAIWGAMEGSNEREQKFQLDSLAYFLQVAKTNPESSIRETEMTELFDFGTLEERVWYRYKIPGFKVIPSNELPAGVAFGIKYASVVITPSTFLPWMREKLEAAGVKFLRASIRSLDDLRGMGHDVLVNATGTGSMRLSDVGDTNLQEVRGQSLLVKTKYDKLFTRRGKDYTYVYARGDGTAILGGIKQYGNADPKVDDSIRRDVCFISILLK